jgi:hypothetical protein
MTRTEREELQTYFDAKFGGIDAKFAAMDKKFDGLETRFIGLETRFAGLELRFDSLETRFVALESSVHGLATRFDGVEVRLDSLEGHVEQNVKNLLGAIQDEGKKSRQFTARLFGFVEAQGGKAPAVADARPAERPSVRRPATRRRAK